MAQSFKALLQEDLNIGTDRVWVQAPGRGRLRATQIGLHTPARGRRSYDSDWTPGAIAAGGKVSTSVTVPDAETGDMVLASHDQILTNDLRITAHTSAADTVEVVIHNPTTSTVTLGAGELRVILFDYRSTEAAIEVYFTWVQATESDSVTFTGNAPGLTNPSFDWNFGDTNTDSGTPVIHGYTHALFPVYTVTMSVTADEGFFEDIGDINMNYASGASGSSQ